MSSTSFRRRKLALGVAAAAGAAVLAGAAAGAPQTASRPGRHILPGSKPSWTNAVSKTADVPASQGVAARVWLAARNSTQLDALADAVSDPSSSQYGQFISADQYRAQFAPDDAELTAVRGWLTQSGLSIAGIGPDNAFVAVSGSAQAVNDAFGTQLAQYVVNGQHVQAPSSDLSVPDEVGGFVLGVTGLNTFHTRVQPADLGAPAAFVNGTPCSDYYGQQQARTLPQFQGQTLPYAVCGYTPDQLRGAYGVDQTRLTGAGQTVAITDAFDSPNLERDANTYSQRRGDRPFARGQFRDLSVPETSDPAEIEACGGNGWYGEQALDVEAVHAMAQNASVLYYGAATCEDADLLVQLAQIVSDNKASIVTNSWGLYTFIVVDGQLFITIDQNLVNTYESIFKRGAVQGIGFYFSSGDSGDEQANTGFTHPDWPTEDPWVTSVGGTSLAVDRRDNHDFETGWGTQRYNLSSDGKSWTLAVPFLYGAGGGFTLPDLFQRPKYQNGVVPGNTQGRGVPDIAAVGDPTTGMLIGETQNFSLPSRFGPAGVHYGEYRIGGTSLSSPLMAGIQADAQQGAHRRIGFANPLIYFLARGRGRSPYYDVVPQPRADAGNIRADYANGINADGGITYSVRTFDHDSSLATARGWDDVTGVGTPTSDYLQALGGR
jgi:subtilase family serine protease